MKNIQTKLFFLFLFLLVTSFAACYFGVQHEINKIPLEQREKMTDFDWIGAQWIALGMVIFFFATLCALGSGIFWLRNKNN